MSMSEITKEQQDRINKRMQELANHKVTLAHANEVRMESDLFPPVPEKKPAETEEAYIHRNVTTLDEEVKYR